ncbi:MAG: DNA-directed RNA polymerase subunit L [Candidatus Methanofastidiosa archaeon]|jgi:DNA-directed RNA polymerase subunit L|nr:DNA-directed RNA polymerase subunit L [Candidatus Methanofastidiosa archaeon]
MELNILSESDTAMELVFVGENHTFANLIRSYLEQDPAVVFSAYRVSHPLLDYEKPVMLIKTDGTKSPRQALTDANEMLKATLHEMKDQL